MNFEEQVINECHQLALEIPCDFVGVAIYNHTQKELQWKYVVGNRNDKYKLITVRYGKGIAGTVVRTGRPLSISNFPEGIIGKPTEYPIMLAEKLVAAMGTPIVYRGTPWGVLLVGNRNQTAFTSDQLEVVKKRADQISQGLRDESSLDVSSKWGS
ncbi:GAF domain-containing protein [Caldalkalibacillus mannanilyticus]|uniref:GAF domain-containing protein n=1 Tax=Caldalkalibacillus mannanilyticus TaxID=1418 RepID=UPI0006852813|nr:GAF domain-containing protein [Caldalkalibacillus mannanilyticus]